MQEPTLTFGQRLNGESLDKVIQLKDMNLELRTALWNVVYSNLFQRFVMANQRNVFSDRAKKWYQEIWVYILNRPLDDYPNDWQVAEAMKEIMLKGAWTKPYELIEDLYTKDIPRSIKLAANLPGTFEDEVNSSLKRYDSGYTLINNLFVPVTNEYELDELETLTNNAQKYNLHNINKHIHSAFELLSKRPNAEYRKVMHESICIVEGICRIIEPDANTLGEALKKIKRSNFDLPVTLNQAFEKIYAYTSSQDGIRHNITLDDKNELDVEEARFFLIMCSAFTNYLIVKAQKAGILQGNGKI
jgi:hypothetical protein